MSRTRWLLIAVVATLLMVGGAFTIVRWSDLEAFVDSDQTSLSDDLRQSIEPGHPIGQTFVARHGGLSGIEFYLLPGNSLPLSLTVHLRADSQTQVDLATASLSLQPGSAPGFYRFGLPPLDTSHGHYYYAFVEASQPGLMIGMERGTAYLDGAAYLDHQPLDAQTGFRLVYAPTLMLRDFAGAALGWLGLLIVAAALFIVPGFAVLTWTLSGTRLSWAEMLGLAAGVSMAIYALLFLWTGLVGLNLGALYAWIPFSLGTAGLLWRIWINRSRHGVHLTRRPSLPKLQWADLALVVVLVLVFAVRLLVVRTLAAPMWADSYHHTMITQLLSDNGGLFESWGPYASVDSFTYHFGFHSAASVLLWLTRLPASDATLLTGQLVNGFAVLAIYPLALRVTRSRWGATWAVLLAGLLSPMPMFYVNWGRYTQLAGQVLLPAAVWLTWEAIETPKHRWPVMLLAAIAVAGLALTHYRVLVFFAAFGLALLLSKLRRDTLLRLFSIAALTCLLALPWIVNSVKGQLVPIVGYYVTTSPTQAHPFIWQYNAVGRLDTFLAPGLWLAMIAGLVVGLWRRQRSILLTGLWWAFVLIATNPAWLGLPGTGVVTNFALVIAAYIPASLLSAVLLATLSESAKKWRIAGPVLALALMALAIWAIPERMADIEPQKHALVTHPDLRAADWIAENTPPDSRFLINFTYGIGRATILGTDGGWWLPMLAGRENAIPPLQAASEVGRDSELFAQVNLLAQALEERDLDDPTVLDLLEQQHFTHVMLGQQQGNVFNVDGKIIDPRELQSSDHYQLVYRQDRVWVFEVKR